MYQIIRKDNFDRDYISEEVIVKDINFKAYADVMAEALNKNFGADANSTSYFIVEPDSYIPYRFEP